MVAHGVGYEARHAAAALSGREQRPARRGYAILHLLLRHSGLRALHPIRAVGVKDHLPAEHQLALPALLAHKLREGLGTPQRPLSEAATHQQVVAPLTERVVDGADLVAIAPGVALVQAHEEVVVEPGDHLVVVQMPEEDHVGPGRSRAKLRVGDDLQPDARDLGNGGIDHLGGSTPCGVIRTADDRLGLALADDGRVDDKRHELRRLDGQRVEQRELSGELLGARGAESAGGKGEEECESEQTAHGFTSVELCPSWHAGIAACMQLAVAIIHRTAHWAFRPARRPTHPGPPIAPA